MHLDLASKCFYLCPVNTRLPTMHLSPSDLFTYLLTFNQTFEVSKNEVMSNNFLSR